jgi:DNA polymerase-4
MPSTTALRKCPDLVFVAPRFDVYRAVSNQIRAIFVEYTPLVEPLSLDEAYLDVTRNLRGLPSASATAAEIRSRILAETGLTASAGVSYNKFLAKLASDYRKPNGQYVITPAAGLSFIEMLPVHKFHGVGPVTAGRMNTLGIFTGADLRRQPLEFLVRHFGKSGPWYHTIARAEDDRAVAPDRPRKSSGSETTFSSDLTEPKAIEAEVGIMADEVWDWCTKTGMYGRTVAVKVKYADFRQITRSRTVTAPIRSRESLRNISVDLVRTVLPPQVGVRLVGVTVSAFSTEPSEQPLQMGFEL